FWVAGRWRSRGGGGGGGRGGGPVFPGAKGSPRAFCGAGLPFGGPLGGVGGGFPRRITPPPPIPRRRSWWSRHQSSWRTNRPRHTGTTVRAPELTTRPLLRAQRCGSKSRRAHSRTAASDLLPVVVGPLYRVVGIDSDPAHL